MLRWLLSLVILWLTGAAYAWDGTGHRIIASIAYDQLTPTAKIKIDSLTNLIDPGYPPYARFLYIATLPDLWRSQGNKTWNAWHFIDTPWSPDNTLFPAVQTPNLLSALTENNAIVSAANPTPQQQAQALAFLVHLTGDIHQPLHCASRYSKDFPDGDHGGNWFPIKYGKITNLHAFWDQASHFLGNPDWRYPYTNKRISTIAKQITAAYPESVYAAQLKETDFKNWAQECFTVAKTIYQLPKNSSPSEEYKKFVHTTTEQQFALAGYRLAQLLEGSFK